MTLFLKLRPARGRRALTRIAVVLALLLGTAWAQSNDSSSTSSGNSSTGSSGSGSANGGSASGTVSATGSETATDGTSESASSDARVPPPTSLQTGQPLLSAISPLRWGHLSLLSASATGIYDGNYQLAQTSSAAQGTEIGMLQLMADFSIRKNRSALDLQYRPSLWYTNGHLNKDWYGHEILFQTSYALTPRDTLTITDHFRYTPQYNPLTAAGFSADFTNFLLAQNPFLAQGTKSLVNNFDAGIEHLIDARNHLDFQVRQDYISVTAPPITPKPQIICFPGLPFCFIKPGPVPKGPLEQRRPSLGFLGTWTHRFDDRNTLTLNYSFERDWFLGTYESNVDFQHIGAGYTRIMTPTVTISLEGGPTFYSSQPITASGAGHVHNTVGLQGVASIFKRFLSGGVVASVARNYQFTGLYSDYFNTTFNLSVEQRFRKKFGVSIGSSYVIQQFSAAPSVHGYTTWADTDYQLARSWAVFSGVHYLHTAGAIYGYAPRTSVFGGVRWSWAPERNP